MKARHETDSAQAILNELRKGPVVLGKTKTGTSGRVYQVYITHLRNAGYVIERHSVYTLCSEDETTDTP